MSTKGYKVEDIDNGFARDQIYRLVIVNEESTKQIEPDQWAAMWDQPLEAKMRKGNSRWECVSLKSLFRSILSQNRNRIAGSFREKHVVTHTFGSAFFVRYCMNRSACDESMALTVGFLYPIY